WVISSNREALKFIGLRPSQKVVLYNGPLECRFQRYSIYSGSKKAKYSGPDSGGSATGPRSGRDEDRDG
ncbi:MAG TPA: hypothetical protein VLA34_15530, partial [Candidatus Krumholzibacterium sp.]|nr:hypothetical protein [Candidatus Krumholzibacterium sp.]